MIVINTVSNERFSLNGIEYFKNFLSFVYGDNVGIYNAYDKTDQRVNLDLYSNFTVDGVVYESAALLQSALLGVIYTRDTLGAVNTVLKGSVKPTDTPTGTGVAFWVATQAGTYTNFGGVVVAANSFAVISRDATGAFSISQTTFDISSKVNVSDVVNNLTSTSTVNPLSGLQGKVLNEKNVQIKTWTAIAFASGDQVNYLGKDWVSNSDTLSTDIPGTSSKWEERLMPYFTNFEGENLAVKKLIQKIEAFKSIGDSTVISIFQIKKTVTNIEIYFNYGASTFSYISTDLITKSERIITTGFNLSFKIWINCDNIAVQTHYITPVAILKESSITYTDIKIPSKNPYFNQGNFGSNENTFINSVQKIVISKYFGFDLFVHSVNSSTKTISLKYTDGTLKYISLVMPLQGWNTVYVNSLKTNFSLFIDWNVLNISYTFSNAFKLSSLCFEVITNNNINSKVFERKIANTPQYLIEAIKDVQMFTSSSEVYHLGRVQKTATSFYLTITNSLNEIVSQKNYLNFIFGTGVQRIELDKYSVNGFDSVLLIDFTKIPIQNITYTDETTIFLESTKRNYSILRRYYGANWMTLGDSVTSRGEYQVRVISRLGINKLVNLGVSGSSLKNFTINVTAENIADIDIISVYGCINDLPNRVIGTMADTVDSETIYGYMKKAINNILTLKPTVKLFFVLTHNVDLTSSGMAFNGTNSLGNKASDYIDAMASVCRYYSIPYLDLYSNIGWNQYNLNYYCTDLVHPNTDIGMPIIGNLITEFIQKI